MSSTDKPGFLIFSGSNDRAALALCRGFSRYEVDFALIARGRDDLLLRSKYAGRFLGTRTSSRVDLAEMRRFVQEARRRYGCHTWIVCPTSEYLNRHLFDFRDSLSREGVELALCSSDLYQRLSDKSSFRSYCEHVGFKLPSLLNSSEAKSIALPFVAKPLKNLNFDDRVLYPYLVCNEKDRHVFLKDPVSDSYYLESFVRGESWYLLYYFDKHGRFWNGSQRNLLQQGHGKSVLLARAQPYPDNRIAADLAERFRLDGYRGFIMVEIRRTDGSSVVIEANPRCWGPLQLTLDARMGIFEAFLNDYGFNVEIPAVPKEGVEYLWTAGIFQALRQRIGLASHAPWRSVATALSRVLADVYARSDSWACYGREFSR